MIAPALQGLEQVFGWLLAASWQASVLALFVLLIQRVLGSRLNPRWRYALWLLVLLRLVLPVLPESALSLFQFAPPPPAALAVSVTEPLFIAAPPIPESNIRPEIPEPTHPFSAYSLLALLWLAAAVALLVLTWQVNRRFARQVANSPAIVDPELLRLFAEARAELGIRRAIRLIENSQVQSPAIMGLFQPTLLLPADVREKFDARELRFIFLHELAHLKRGDVIVQALIALLQILHWFNPVLWFAFRRMRIDREPATDALVLSRTGEEEKERYGLMLIKLLEHFNQRHSLPTLVGILEDKDQFKRRFSLIARFTRGAYGWSLLGVLLIGILSIACLTKAKAASTVVSSSSTAKDTNQQMLQAVQKGDATTLQKLIDQGVDPKKVISPSGSLLIDAKTPEIAEILLNHGVDPNARITYGETPLSVICANPDQNATEIARVLLKHGADPNARAGRFDNTPLMLAYDGATVDLLLEHGADLKATNSEGVGMFSAQPLWTLSRFQALQRHGVTFDALKDGPTMLTGASLHDNMPVVKWLLEHGVDPNTAGAYYSPVGHIVWMTPLWAAAISGKTEAASLLLDHGAKSDEAMAVALRNHHDDFVKLLRGRDPHSISELCYQISHGAPLVDLQKLLDQGSPANPPEDKVITPLGEAVQVGNMDAVKLLIAHHADVNAGGLMNSQHPDVSRATPLWLAASEGYDEIVEYLLSHGATPEPTALWQAADSSSSDPNESSSEHFERAVRLLLDAGAAKTASPEMAGRILAAPIETIHGSSNAKVLKMLLDSGLSPEAPMPHLVENGEKPNTVIGYYQDYCQKYKDDPSYGQTATRVKPLLDMLEAADKGASKSRTEGATDPAGSTTGNPALNQTLIEVAKDGRTDKVGKGDADKIGQLLDQGADPNAKTKDGTSALVWALNFGKDDAAQVLIQHGADASAEDAAGRNAAWTAASIYFCPGALELMIKKGVDVKGLNKKGDTIFSAMTLAPFAAQGKMNFLNDRVWTDAEFLAYEKRERRVVELLIAAGVDINGKSGPESETPLMLAAHRGHLELARALIAHGANLSLKDANGETAASLAKMYGHPELLPVLENR